MIGTSRGYNGDDLVRGMWYAPSGYANQSKKTLRQYLFKILPAENPFENCESRGHLLVGGTEENPRFASGCHGVCHQ